MNLRGPGMVLTQERRDWRHLRRIPDSVVSVINKAERGECTASTSFQLGAREISFTARRGF